VLKNESALTHLSEVCYIISVKVFNNFHTFHTSQIYASTFATTSVHPERYDVETPTTSPPKSTYG
jgi:hypothetical protein